MGRIASRIFRAGLLLFAMLVSGTGASAEAVNFGTDWKAEAEHGGF